MAEAQKASKSGVVNPSGKPVHDTDQSIALQDDLPAEINNLNIEEADLSRGYKGHDQTKSDQKKPLEVSDNLLSPSSKANNRLKNSVLSARKDALAEGKVFEKSRTSTEVDRVDQG